GRPQDGKQHGGQRSSDKSHRSTPFVAQKSEKPAENGFPLICDATRWPGRRDHSLGAGLSRTLPVMSDTAARAQLAAKVRLDSVNEKNFDTVFYPGGHGPMRDLAEDHNSIKLIESFLGAAKTIALVCHAPGALRRVKTADGKPLVEG